MNITTTLATGRTSTLAGNPTTRFARRPATKRAADFAYKYQGRFLNGKDACPALTLVALAKPDPKRPGEE